MVGLGEVKTWDGVGKDERGKRARSVIFIERDYSLMHG